MSHTDIVAFNGGLRRPKAQSDVLEPPSPSLPYSCALRPLTLSILENMGLLLKSALRLHCQFGRHGCGLMAGMSLLGFKVEVRV